MTYRAWRDSKPGLPTYMWLFWEIIDANWTPEEQNVLAREWKERSSS